MEYDRITFLIGALSGMTGVLISHPIDTMKTIYQQNKPISYKPQHLYKGLIPPLLGVGFEKAIVFGVYENSQILLNEEKIRKSYSIALSGAISGFAASFIVTPCERIKIQLQSNQKFSSKMFNPKLLFNGLSACFTREIPGFAIYFSFFEFSKRNYLKHNQCNQLPMYASFIFGGMSGATSWLFIYPQDKVKTIMQASHEKIKFGQAIKNIYISQGLKGFLSGFQYALMRAIPLHAGTFMMREKLNNLQNNLYVDFQLQ